MKNGILGKKGFVGSAKIKNKNGEFQLSLILFSFY
jgi:hypothetical protein